MESGEPSTMTIIISDPFELDVNVNVAEPENVQTNDPETYINLGVDPEQGNVNVKPEPLMVYKDSLQAVVDECIRCIPGILPEEMVERKEFVIQADAETPVQCTGEEIIVICAGDDPLESVLTEEVQNMEGVEMHGQTDAVPTECELPKRRRRKGPRKTKKLSNDLRKKIIDYVIGKGYSFSRTGRDLNVCRGTIASVVRTFRLENRTEKIRSNGRKTMFTPEQEALLVEFMKGREDATVRKIENYISENPDLFPGVTYVSKTTLYKILNRNQCLRKYIDKLPGIRNDAEILEARRAYVAALYPDSGKEPGAEKHIYVDIAGFRLNLLNRSKRAFIGERVDSRHASSRGGSISFCMAMSVHGVYHSKFQLRAFGLSEFLGFLQELCERLPAGLTIILDDVRFNHDEVIREYLSFKKHTVVYIPGYSAFLNPVLNASWKVRTSVKDQEMSDRYALLKALEKSMEGITMENCAEWINATRQYYEACVSLTPIINSTPSVD